MNDKDNLTIVYYASTDDFANADLTANAEREAQIAASPDEVKLQRRLAWIALQRAADFFAETTGITPPQIRIAGNSRPQATGAYVSVGGLRTDKTHFAAKHCRPHCIAAGTPHTAAAPDKRRVASSVDSQGSRIQSIAHPRATARSVAS